MAWNGLSSLISGVSSVGGSLLGGLFSNRSADEAWERQKEYAQNAHQWEVQDLLKAGLNPVLSATGGSGASMSSVPVSQAGSEVNKGFQNIANALQLKTLEGADLANRAKAKLDLSTANAQDGYKKDLAVKQMEQINSEINVNAVECGKIIAQTKNFNALTAESQKKVEVLGQQIVNLVQEQKNLVKQGRAIDEQSFASHSMGVSSLASAQVSVATANLVNKQVTGQTLSNDEKAVLTRFAKEHPMLYTYAKTAKSPSAMVGILAGSAIDLYNTLAPYVNKLIKK